MFPGSFPGEHVPSTDRSDPTTTPAPVTPTEARLLRRGEDTESKGIETEEAQPDTASDEKNWLDGDPMHEDAGGHGAHPRTPPPAEVSAANLSIRNGDRTAAREIVRRGLEINPNNQQLLSLEKLLRPKASTLSEGQIETKKNSLLGSLFKNDDLNDDPPETQEEPSPRMAGLVSPASFSGMGLAARGLPQTAFIQAAVQSPALQGAVSLMRQKDMPAAISSLSKTLSSDPRNVPALKLRGLAFLGSNQPTQAFQDADLILRFSPRDPEAYLLRAKALSSLGRNREALDDLEQTIAINPRFADAYATRAMIKQAMNDLPGALADAQIAASLDPAFQALFRDLYGAQKAKEPSRKQAHLPIAPLYGGAGLLGLGLMAYALLRKRGNTVVSAKAADSSIGGFDPIRRLGRGGMGEVWEAFDRALERKVAIKQLIAEIAASPRERARFLKEARIVAGLRHPGIVEIYQVVEQGDDLFLVFEHVSGLPLDAVIAERPLSLSGILDLSRQAADALDYAHAQGVVHQDLKPANIMLSGKTVKIMDFGIARRVAETVGAVTRMEVIGTPSYMAPEQAQGAASPQSDVFSLAATLYEAVSGRRPFSGTSDMVKIERAYAPLSSLAAGIPPAVDAVIDRALDPEPEKRFASAGEFHQALQSASLSPV